MTTPLSEALDELRRQLDSCAHGVDGLETLILELIGRAGAQGDPSVVQRVQAVDALAQQIRRLATVAGDLADGGAAQPEPLKETLAVLARRVAPTSAVAGEMDLF
jgi:hypothetical protein